MNYHKGVRVLSGAKYHGFELSAPGPHIAFSTFANGVWPAGKHAPALIFERHIPLAFLFEDVLR